MFPIGGVIGGADGPTAIFVSSGPADFVLPGAILAALILAAVLWRRKRRK